MLYAQSLHDYTFHLWIEARRKAKERARTRLGRKEADRAAGPSQHVDQGVDVLKQASAGVCDQNDCLEARSRLRLTRPRVSTNILVLARCHIGS